MSVPRRQLFGSALAGALLCAGAALAHGNAVSFLVPSGAGAPVPSGAPVTLRWANGVSLEKPTVHLYVSREPFDYDDTPPDPTTYQEIATLPLTGTSGEYVWTTTGVAPGCYQPFAVVSDSKGNDFEPSFGKITVAGPDFVPPTIWVTNDPNDEVDAYGRFEVRFRVQDPDSAMRVVLKTSDLTVWRDIVTDLRFEPGTHDAVYPFDVRGMPISTYDIYAEVHAEGEPSCGAYWESTYQVTGGPWAEPPSTTPDGGQTVEEPDEPEPDPPPIEDPPPPAKRPVGCGATGALVSAAALAAVLLRQTRGRRRQAGPVA